MNTPEITARIAASRAQLDEDTDAYGLWPEVETAIDDSDGAIAGYYTAYGDGFGA